MVKNVASFHTHLQEHYSIPPPHPPGRPGRHHLVGQVSQHVEPKLCALGLGHPQTHQLFAAVHIRTQGQVHRTIGLAALVAALHHQRIEVDEGPDSIQWADCNARTSSQMLSVAFDIMSG